MHRGTSSQRHPWFVLRQIQVSENHGLRGGTLEFDVTPHIPALDRDGDHLPAVPDAPPEDWS